jgi:hypothetical protein
MTPSENTRTQWNSLSSIPPPPKAYDPKSGALRTRHVLESDIRPAALYAASAAPFQVRTLRFYPNRQAARPLRVIFLGLPAVTNGDESANETWRSEGAEEVLQFATVIPRRHLGAPLSVSHQTGGLDAISNRAV